MKHFILFLACVGVLFVSCKKDNPYDTNLTAKFVGVYNGTLDSLSSSTSILRTSDTTFTFDLYYQDSTQHLRFDSVAVTAAGTFNMHGNSTHHGYGKFQGNILIYTISNITDSTELHKFYGNK